MSKIKDEIMALAEETSLTNKQIAKVVGCSVRTVARYAGGFVNRSQAKANLDKEAWKIQKTVLLPDIHYPYYEQKVMEAINEFIIDYQPNNLIYMGDQMALESVSQWEKKKPLLKEGRRLIKEYKGFNNDILKVHEKITNNKTKRIFMFGNHEQRVQWYIEKMPELEGFIDIESNLQLEERGYEVIPFNGVYNLGKLQVIHGYYWNKYHAVKTLDAFEGNIVYCHVHNPQMYAKVSPIDRTGYHTATSLPCICSIKPAYKRNAPNFWVNGFGFVEHLPATGFFNLYSIIIIDGSFMFNGKYYGKKI